MSSSYSDGTGGFQEDIGECMAKLSLLLHDALTAAGESLPSPHYFLILSEPPLYTLSNSLLKALAAAHLNPHHDSGELLSFAGQHRDKIAHALETISLRCFSAYLLKLPKNDGLELGLYLLTDEPEYIAYPDAMRSQMSIPETVTSMPLVQESLLQQVYAIFTNLTGDTRMRRMAGKVLAEIMGDSDEHCHLLKKLDGDAYLKRIVRTLSEMDVVLSFFSSIIIRAVYQSTSYNDWVSDGPPPKILRHLQTQRDAVEQFHSYVREEKQHTFSISGKTSRGGANGNLPMCYLVELGGAYLIHCIKDTSGYKMNYMAIRVTQPTQTQCTFSTVRGGQKRLLSLQIHEDDKVTVNDQQRDLKIINLGIKSEYDSIGISKGFEAIGIRCRTKTSRMSSSSRRSSSIVIPLDTDDEIISSSFEPSAVASQTVAGWASPSALWGNQLANMLEQSDYVPEPDSSKASQSSLTDLTRTPSLHATSSPRTLDSSRPNSPKSATKCQQKKKRRAVERAAAQEKEHLPETGPARNTRSKSSQSSKSVATNNALRPVPHNTQESLIFPRCRSKRKLYTAPRTKIVDWDEDLRASQGSIEPRSQKDDELTSVSSPSSAGVCYTFNQSSKRPRKGSVKQAAKTRRQPGTGRKRQAKRRTNNRTEFLKPEHKRPKNGTSQRSPPMDGSERELKRDTEAHKHETCNGTAKSLAEINIASQAREVESLSHQISSSPGPQSSSSSNGPFTLESSLKDGQHTGGNTPGRGQTVAEKLIAALRGSNTPEHYNNEAYVNGKLFSDTVPGVEVVPGISETQNELHHQELKSEQEKCKDDKQDMIDCWASVMSPESISGDEIYSVKIYSGESSDECRNNQLQRSGEHNRITRKREAIFEAENGEESERIRRPSASVSSSSVEPLSTESTSPGAHNSSPSLNKSPKSPFLSRPEQATTASRTFEFYLSKLPLNKGSSTFIDHSGVFALSRSVNQKLCATHLEGATTKECFSWNPEVGDNGAAQPSASTREKCSESEKGHATECLESSAKTIVDKNGSPRRMQRANMAKGEHSTLKLQNTSTLIEQRNSKRTKGINQEGNRYVALPTTDNQTKDTAGTFQLATEGSSTEFGASRITPTEKGDHQLSLNHLQASVGERHFSKDLEPAAPGPKMEQEQHQTSGSKEYALERPGLAAGAELQRKVAFELSESPAGQTNWQTSLQELHKGMERTLRSNNEYLSRQIESEKATINGVLNGYREQCHSVLDRLFEAQVDRIRLCKQQMDSIKQQHADVCHGLIRRLEENERTLGAAWGSH
ncbi:hypothetical protein BDW66DRAFT_154616 [Aspergillus desertorum]